jgi:hypothetical protein
VPDGPPDLEALVDRPAVHVEILAAPSSGFILPWSEGRLRSHTNLRRYAIALRLCSIEGVVALNAIHARLFRGARAAGLS